MKSICVSAVVVLFCSSMGLAQELPQFPGPRKEHELLKRFVGKWETIAEASMGPGQPVMKCEGSMDARMLGGLWVVAEMKSTPMGQPMNALLTVGYDEKSKKYVGTWIDSMINHMWKYQGSFDKTGKILTLEAEGPNFMLGGKLSKFRDIYEFQTKDRIKITSQAQGEDGQWITFMTGSAQRKK